MSRSQPTWSPVWLTCVLVGLAAVHTLAKEVPAVPQQVDVSPDKSTQQLSISWLGGAAATFDLLILRTELNETVFYETVSVSVNQASGRHQWTWTSVEPLECTSLSVRIRSRDGQTTSDWSSTETLESDIPSNAIYMFPQDRVVPVGSNTTFCCIVEKGKQLRTIKYDSTVMHPTPLSSRSYSVTAVNQTLSNRAGSNVVCRDTPEAKMNGAVVFVGYPPRPSDLVCETHDLTSAVCRWKGGRDTNLYGKRGTKYMLNNRQCIASSTEDKLEGCSETWWEGNWTLVAKNPLGQHVLTDAAELIHRVRPTAPENPTSVVTSWNATVRWGWKYDVYSSLALVCQAELTPKGDPAKPSQHTFSGLGLRSVTLLDLYPDEEYGVRVRCGAQHNFWKWGNWSETISFRTNTYAPDALDVWMWMNKNYPAQVLWKPLTPRQSHGPITDYEVTLWSSEENLQRTAHIPPDTSAELVNLTQITTLGSDKITATVVARNTGGESQPASVHIPLRLTDVEPRSVSRVFYTDGGFPLSWERDDNATGAYVVDWYNAVCSSLKNCPVGWIKLAAGNTSVSVESADFRPGVMYNISLYSSTSEAPELLQRWQGYIQELVPSSSVSLSTTQQDADILLAWGEIPLANRRGFLLGYNVYINNGTQLTLLANLSDPGSRNYTVKGLSEGSYKFTIKAYTSAGEDTGATASIMLEPYADWLILEIFASLGITSAFLLIGTIFCYKKRKWVKKAFYPDIPEPKLPGDWSRPQGPLDVKPSPHSLVHMVEKPEWDSSKETLVVIPEEDEDEERLGDDTDEPASLRYYNHVVDERPIRPRFPDSSASSASSMDSARTDVTYTGIQTSGSSLVFQPDPEGSSEVHQPPAHPSFCTGEGGGGGGGGYRPQMQSRAQNDDMGLASPEPSFEPQAASAGGYKPQSSWHFDSLEEAGESQNGLAPSLGSPTSIASTQFLLPDGDEQADERRQPAAAAAAWFTNLLSSTKP
uniref:Fibronectin type-III domain-containing protein n=1 Tax=Gasterosteus aculeatus aculeatus TaxID=481459 RepID=A0AAQ4RZU8_GASAC|nr:LIF receptor subunit alpha a [Gasterosteus aculeatus aculeatus]